MQRPYKSSAWSYLIQDVVYAGPHAIYERGGPCIESYPVGSAKLHDTGALTAIIRTALSEFQVDLPSPPMDRGKRPVQPILQVTKIKSYKALVASAKLVTLTDWPDGRVEFTPWRNLGPRDGYDPILPPESAADEEDLASALFRAYQRCS